MTNLQSVLGRSCNIQLNVCCIKFHVQNRNNLFSFFFGGWGYSKMNSTAWTWLAVSLPLPDSLVIICFPIFHSQIFPNLYVYEEEEKSWEGWGQLKAHLWLPDDLGDKMAGIGLEEWDGSWHQQPDTQTQYSRFMSAKCLMWIWVDPLGIRDCQNR